MELGKGKECYCYQPGATESGSVLSVPSNGLLSSVRVSNDPSIELIYNVLPARV